MRFSKRLLILATLVLVSCIIVIFYRQYISSKNVYDKNYDDIVDILSKSDPGFLIVENDPRPEFSPNKGVINANFYATYRGSASKFSTNLAIILVTFMLSIVLLFTGICCVIIVAVSTETNRTDDERDEDDLCDDENDFCKTRHCEEGYFKHKLNTLNNMFADDFESEFHIDHLYNVVKYSSYSNTALLHT